MSPAITLKGNPIQVVGNELSVGEKAPDFVAQDVNLNDVKLSDSDGKVRILSFVPSLDTSVCDESTRKLNQFAKQNPETLVLVVSVDLPMAQKRWCGAADVENVQTLSAHRSLEVGDLYGLRIQDGPLARFLARAVFVLDKERAIQHAEYVPEIAQLPDLDSATNKAKELT